MQLNITFRHFDASDFLKEHVREKLERVTRHLDHAAEAHVVLDLERHLHRADITVHAGPILLRAEEASGDMYSSVDLAVEKLERQLRAHKDRLKQHHGRERVHHRQDLVADGAAGPEEPYAQAG